MAEVVTHVISAEGQHCHGIAAHFADRACGGRCRFRAHGGSYVNARTPVECLVNEGHGSGPSSSENNGADGNALRILPSWIDGWTLRGGRCKPGVRMGRLSAG